MSQQQQPPQPPPPKERGAIAWFCRNPVAANLLMVFLLVLGGQALLGDTLTYEVFPEFEADAIGIATGYPGATPLQVEEGITLAVEEAISEVEGIKKITSTSSEGSSFTRVEGVDGYDINTLQTDLKDAIDHISTFPDQAKTPSVTQANSRRQVIDLLISGNTDQYSLLKVAEQVRDRLLQLGLTSVELDNPYSYLITIEIPPEKLEEYQLDMATITRRIKAATRDGGAGSLDSSQGSLLLRTSNRLDSLHDYANIQLKRNEDNSQLLLGQIATIRKQVETRKNIQKFDNQPAVNLEVSRTSQENALKISRTVREFIANNQGMLPQGVQMDYWRDYSNLLNQRLSLMINNGLQGFVLVLLILSLFLRPKVAFWVSLGIPISFCGTLALLPLFGGSINMVTLFGFILVLGIVVDDAIVTGESIFTKMQSGETSGTQAAILGTQEVAVPVTFGVLTTVAAFLPLAAISGNIGNVFAQIPLVVIPVLLISLVESKLVLPSHLCHISLRQSPNRLQRAQQWVATGLERFIDKVYQPLIITALRRRYFTLSLFIAISLVIAGAVTSGWIHQSFLPRVASNTLRASISFDAATPFPLVERAVERLNAAALQLRVNYQQRGMDVVERVQMVVREDSGRVAVQLTSAEQRPKTLGNNQLLRDWRALAGEFPEAQSVSYRGEIGRFADPVSIELQSRDATKLTEVSRLLQEKMREFPNLYEIADNFGSGKQQIDLRLTPKGESLGLDLEQLSSQIRNGFYGYEVDTLLDGRDEIPIELRYPDSYRQNPALLGSVKVRTSLGEYVPLGDVATITQSVGPPEINRIDRRRTLRVTAEADSKQADIPAIERELNTWLSQLLEQRYPEVSFVSKGENFEMQKALGELGQAFLVLLVVMYALLAIPLKSYLKPLLIMAITPFAASYAVLGHLLLGMGLSLPSYMGIVALLGVAINDSLVLVVYIDRQLAAGRPLVQAVATAGARRFRPIMLTSLTTFFGLLPLTFERSVQAQFILPSGVSLGWGILFTTFATLFLVPALYLVLDDCVRLLRRYLHLHQPDPLIPVNR